MEHTFSQYVKTRDASNGQIDEGLFGKSDPHAPGWLASQDQKNQYAANKNVSAQLPAFMKAVQELAAYATPEKAGKMGQALVKLGQADTNNFLNKPLPDSKGKAHPMSQHLKAISDKYQIDMFNDTGFKNYDQYNNALRAVRAVQEQGKVAQKRFNTNIQTVLKNLQDVVAKDHGPQATQKPAAPALGVDGSANVGAQKQGIGSRIGSGIGKLFGGGK